MIHEVWLRTLTSRLGAYDIAPNYNGIRVARAGHSGTVAESQVSGVDKDRGADPQCVGTALWVICEIAAQMVQALGGEECHDAPGFCES
jgi:hypothetical protein